MKIAIPTYKRAILIQKYTLSVLKKNGFEESDIDLFVSGEKEAEQYRSVCDCNIIVTDATSAKEKFNAIHKHYPEGEHVVVLEDDLKTIKRLVGYNQLVECETLENEFCRGFNLCQDHGTKLWGINSNNNPFFMKYEPSVGFKFIVANCYGFISDHDTELLITQPSKGDYERTIRYFIKFNNLIRLDYLCPVTTNYSTPGGMQYIVDQRAAMEEQSVHFLTTTYPNLCQRNEKKKSLYPEISLRQQKNKSQQATPERPSNDIMDFL